MLAPCGSNQILIKSKINLVATRWIFYFNLIEKVPKKCQWIEDYKNCGLNNPRNQTWIKTTM